MSEQEQAAFAAEIEKLKQEEPMQALQIGGKDLLQRLVNAMQTDQGVHVESLLAIIGALAGYSAIYTVMGHWDAQTMKQKMEQKEVMVLGYDNDTNLILSNEVNQLLINQEYSFWALVGGMADHLGAEELVDINTVVDEVMQHAGTDQFGWPSLPENSQISRHPISYVLELWEPVQGPVHIFCRHSADAIQLFGFAAQEAMQLGKDVVTPEEGLRILMDSAVATSRVLPFGLKNEGAKAN